MHRVKLRRIGKSLGLALPTDALARLKVGDGDILILTDTPDGFRLTSHDKDFEDAMEAAELCMRKFHNALRELAK